MKTWSKNPVSRLVQKVAIAACILAVLPSCSNSENFVSSLHTETFTQGYNPHFLEILWVIDDRSPMKNYRDKLLVEARNFLVRLDASLQSKSDMYKMAITSTDGRFNVGGFKPASAPNVLTRGDGSLEERVFAFGNVLFPIANLSTDASSRGLAASLAALKKPGFKLDARVPLVLVYLAYGDDDSEPVTSLDPVDYYASEILALKNNKADLVRAYAANYMPVAPGTPLTSANRCAKPSGNQIDVDFANYEDRYFRLATKLGGTTADLCQAGFSNTFDLSGLQLTTLPKVFNIQGFPRADTLKVTMTDSTGQALPVTPAYTYNPADRTITFDVAPPEGVAILVTYLNVGQ